MKLTTNEIKMYFQDFQDSTFLLDLEGNSVHEVRRCKVGEEMWTTNGIRHSSYYGVCDKNDTFQISDENELIIGYVLEKESEGRTSPATRELPY